MSLVVEGFRSDVQAVADIGDEVVAEAAERIAAVLSRSASSRILDLLSDVVAELSAELPEGRVEIRLVGDDVEFAYVDETPATPEADAELSARITLRLSEQLKARVEESAARQATSVNSWVVRVLERATVSPKSRHDRPGSRLRGHGMS